MLDTLISAAAPLPATNIAMPTANVAVSEPVAIPTSSFRNGDDRARHGRIRKVLRSEGGIVEWLSISGETHGLVGSHRSPHQTARSAHPPSGGAAGQHGQGRAVSGRLTAGGIESHR